MQKVSSFLSLTFHPSNRVFISKVGSSGTIVVAGVGADESVSGSCGIHVDVFSQQTFEHGSGFTGLDVKDHLAVLVVPVHVLDGL